MRKNASILVSLIALLIVSCGTTTKYSTCIICSGSGNCQRCQGTGEAYGGVCIYCEGDRSCRICKGSGQTSYEVSTFNNNLGAFLGGAMEGTNSHFNGN